MKQMRQPYIDYSAAVAGTNLQSERGRGEICVGEAYEAGKFCNNLGFTGGPWRPAFRYEARCGALRRSAARKPGLSSGEISNTLPLR